ncbi:hypothetical protein L1987_15352 [Smallanthus sonchifolius]|uniref:Uncharacterized protein n=1 Tax=Smallanthus sonchifolius TaxID=185202 RepID=A0ACB9J7L9_9ASTR|nr:hypothetical protein L1987_15352 [Smallanthus sonchifolius]
MLSLIGTSLASIETERIPLQGRIIETASSSQKARPRRRRTETHSFFSGGGSVNRRPQERGLVAKMVRSGGVTAAETATHSFF